MREERVRRMKSMRGKEEKVCVCVSVRLEEGRVNFPPLTPCKRSPDVQFIHMP